MDEKDFTLWCGNLDDNVNEELLYELFLQAGPLTKVVLASDKDGGRKGFAFITFQHIESVPYSINLMNGIRLCGRSLRLQVRPGSIHDQRLNSSNLNSVGNTPVNESLNASNIPPLGLLSQQGSQSQIMRTNLTNSLGSSPMLPHSQVSSMHTSVDRRVSRFDNDTYSREQDFSRGSYREDTNDSKHRRSDSRHSGGHHSRSRSTHQEDFSSRNNRSRSRHHENESSLRSNRHHSSDSMSNHNSFSANRDKKLYQGERLNHTSANLQPGFVPGAVGYPLPSNQLQQTLSAVLNSPQLFMQQIASYSNNANNQQHNFNRRNQHKFKKS